MQYEASDLGRRVMFYDGIPVLESDFLVDTETIASGAYATKTTKVVVHRDPLATG